MTRAAALSEIATTLHTYVGEAMKAIRIVIAVAAALTALEAAAQASVTDSRWPGRVYVLPATLETTQWGWFDSAQKPVLTIDSGDTVVMETMMAGHNAIIPGITVDEMMKIRADNPGRGPHSVTGPIYVNNAEPGDALKIELRRIVPRAYAVNFNLPGSAGTGLLPKEFPTGRVRYVYLDWTRKVTEFLPGVYVPLRPFPGTIGVARKEPGRHNTVPPGEYGGNMDVRDLVEGTTLYLPVFQRGGLLWTGDSHAAQGNGEVNLTAVETAFKEFVITVSLLKNSKIDFPLIESASSWITVGFDRDLNKAWEVAREQTTRLLSERRKLTPEQAAAAMVQGSDCRVSQVVNIKRGVHCLSSKDAKRAEDMERPTKETAKYHVTHAQHADLNQAMTDAALAMIRLLESRRGIDRLDAYSLASVGMDCRLGAMSEAAKNVHCVIPKSFWKTPG